jgi:SAM-dependent methyltransferase
MNNEFSYEGRDLETMAILLRYYRWILEMFSPYLSGHAVEFGAGQGTISEILLPRIDKLDLIEPSANLFEVLRQKFDGNERIALFDSTLEDHLKDAAPASRDVAILVNVLEHIEDDRWALIEIMKLLKPGGTLLLFVPALRILYSEFDRLVGHYRRYHRDEVGQLVSAVGFEIISNKYCDVLGVLPWLILNKYLGSTKLNPKLAGLYDYFGIPLTRSLEKIIAPPFGKNVVLIARRPIE